MRLATAFLILHVWALSACCSDGHFLEADSQEVAVQNVSRQIDELLEKSWRENEVQPAEPADDAEFLRRACLDLTGRIPHVSVVREFLDRQQAGDRRQMIDRLLDSPGYVTSFADFWTSVLIPETRADPQLRLLQPGFEAWVREQLIRDVPYDRMVRELLTAKIRSSDGDPRPDEPAPDVFFRVKQFKPESIAAATSRVFLGVRLECAQCHNHPFDAWKQDQFWGFAAFFSGLSADQSLMQVTDSEDRRRIQIPDTDRTIEAAFLNVEKPDWQTARTARSVLADWITAPENPWFARMAVNRIWAHFFGRGFVEPVDDFMSSSTPDHPAVLDLLAREFVRHQYDMRFLIRVITATKAWQLSSRSHADHGPPYLFARMPVRGLSPMQVFNSLSVALGTFEPFTVPGQFVDRPAQAEFYELFRNESDGVQERRTTILQALSLMNGPLMSDGTSLESSRTLRAIVDYPLMSAEKKIETLYLATLSRYPTATERTRMRKHLEASGDEAKGLADILWVLLNTTEFAFNH